MPLFGKIIVIKRTGADGYNFPLTSSSCLFGRKSECDIRIQLPHVSKEHCKLEVNENNEVILTNLSEVNQTLLNGKIIQHSERLKHRDTFTVIDRSFRFEYPLDSVHNTSPRKKRNSLTLKNETLQGVDGDSQPSINDQSSSSEHKPDKIKVDKGLRVSTKSPKVTPNEREDPGLQNQHRRSFTKLLNDEKPTDSENLSPFTKLYEMVKQQATKSIQTKSNKCDMSESVEENSADLIKQTCIPAKQSNVTISQNGKSLRASANGRMNNIRLEEKMMAKADENKGMRELNPLLIEDFTNVAFSASTADINTPKKNKMEVNKFTEQPTSVAKVTPTTSLTKGAKGKELSNDQATKETPKGKHKSQFMNRKSLTLGAAPKNFEDILEPSVEKDPDLVEKSVQSKNVEGANVKSEPAESNRFSEPSVVKSGVENNLVHTECTPIKKDEEDVYTPKRRGRAAIGNKNVGDADIESKQVPNILESSLARLGMESNKVNLGLMSIKIDEKIDTTKRRSRSSLRNKNMESADIDSKPVESTNVLESSVTKLGMENDSNNKGLMPVKTYKGKADTPKRQNRSSLHNNNVGGANIDSKQAESTNVLESSVEKSNIESNTVNLGLIPVNIGEKADTSKRRSQSSLSIKNVDSANIDPKQVGLTNVLDSSVAKSGTENDKANKGLKTVKMGEEKGDTSKMRRRSSLHNKNVGGKNNEATNVESSAELVQEEDNSVDMSFMAINIGERTVNTTKRSGRLSLRNKNVEAAADQLVQSEITHDSKYLTAQSEVENNSADVGRTAARIDEGKVDTPKRHGRSSLRDKMEATDIHSEQTELTNVSEPSTAKSCGEIKLVNMGCIQDKTSEDKTPKRRGRPSLHDKNVGAVDAQGGQAVKSESEDKLLEKQPVDTPRNQGRSSLRKENMQTTEVSHPLSKSSTLRGSASPSSPFQISRRVESNEDEYSTKVESLKKKDRTSGSPHGNLTNKQPEKRRSHVAPINMPDEELNVQYIPKKRRSGNENFDEPVLKRKRVSFGANLSPELFDKRMPPCSPLRKGGTPTRVSTPFRLAPRAVLKRTSSIGIHTSVIQECSEQSENYTSSVKTNNPSANASPKKSKISPCKASSLTTSAKSTTKRSPSVKSSLSLTIKQSPSVKNSSAKLPSSPCVKSSPVSRIPSQKKISSSDTKKSPRSKASSIALSRRMSLPITAGSFGSPQLTGCFSTSRVATPPTLPQSVKSHITPKSLSLTQLDPSHRKSISGKKASRKSTRKSVSLLAEIQSRRHNGASVGNLLVKKSWAQVVKEGVVRPQLRNAAKKPIVKRKRVKNVTSLKVMPTCLVKDHFSTGHAASPATIVIGKLQANNAKLTGQPPRLTRIASLRQKDKEMDESFTGVAEMFSTPMNVNEKSSVFRQTSDIVDDAQAALDVPIFQKVLENSATKTPEETGVKAVTPLTRSVRHKTVSRLLKCRADLSHTSISPSETPFKGTETSSEAEDIGDYQRTMKIPRVKGQPVDDMVGVKRIMKTPKVKGQPVDDMVGVKRIMKTPRVKGQPVEDMAGVKQIMKTPRVKEQPVEDMAGVKRIMKTPKVKGQPVEDMAGVKRIMKTPKVKGQPVEDMAGVKRIMKTPKVKGQPVEDMVGVKRIMKTPRVKGQPVEDMVGVKRIMKTPKVKGQPVEDMVGVKRMMKTPRTIKEPMENFVGLQKLFMEPKRKLESPEISYDGIENIFCAEKEMENCDYSGLGEMFSTPVKSENVTDSKLQLCSKSADKSTLLDKYSDTQTTETPESNLMQLMEKHNGAYRKETPRGTDHNSRLTPRVQATRTRDAQARCTSSPSSQEVCIQQSHQAETLQTLPKDGLVDYPQTGIAEGKDGESLTNSQVSPETNLFKEKKAEDTDAEESIKSTPGKKSPCKQIEEIITFKKKRSLEEKNKIPNIPKVEFDTPKFKTKGTVMSKNESPDKKDEFNNLLSPVTMSLRRRKNIKESNELFTHSKIAPTDESQNGQICEVKENASAAKKSLKGKEIQNVQDSKVKSPPSSKISTQHEGSITEIEKVMPLASRKRPQRKKEAKNTKINDGEETCVAKDSQSKGAECAQIELVKSPLEKLPQERSEIENVESERMTKRHLLPKMPVTSMDANDLVAEDVKAPIAMGRLRRRKNINIDEMEMPIPPKATNPSKRAACTQAEVLKESSRLQTSSGDQEENSKTIVNFVLDGSVREETKSENVKIPKKVNLAGSKYRSTRRKRVSEELLSEDFKQDSAPIKRLYNGEQLDETLTNNTVPHVSNPPSPNVSDKALEISEGMSNGKEVSKRPRRGKVAIKKVNEQASKDLVETLGKVISKHPSDKIIADANEFHESDEQQKGSPKQNEASMPCEPLLIKKEKNNERKREEIEIKQHSEFIPKLSPSPIKRSLRKKASQKITQNKEENANQLSCTRKLRRNITEEKIKATINDGPCVPVNNHSSKEQKHILNEEESIPSSKMRGKGKQSKELLTKNQEQTDQQQTVGIVDVQLYTTSEDEPPSQKLNSKGRRQGKTSAKGISACLSNVEEEEAHLNSSANFSEVANHSDKAEAARQTRSSSKGKVSKAAGVTEVTNDSKETDAVLIPGIEGTGRPKRNIKRGKSEKAIAPEFDITGSIPVTGEEIVERIDMSKKGSKEFPPLEDSQKTELDNRKLPRDKCGKRKIMKDVPTFVQETIKEELQINNEIVESVEIPRKSGRGMIKRRNLAGSNQELVTGATENKQVENSINKVENKKARTGRSSNVKETASTSFAQGGKVQVTSKRARRNNLQKPTDNDENLLRGEDETEDNSGEQETNIISTDSSQVSKRVTRAKKSSEATGMEQKLLQPLTSGLLSPVSANLSKRTLRGKPTVAETTADVPAKKAKKEQLTRKETSSKKETNRATARKVLSITPQTAQPKGRTTRSRK
ncbi:proliferation marker protein Ki-67 isoform X2 [Mobula hypostoma]|uniref:proliferation marker protein Ki-67 isoform X2 n=1 Tax=Mobula hypostoma TaxID=723540 RepID=UPI002FC2B255